MIYRNLLLSTGLSLLYYLTIRLFVDNGLITGYTLLGEVKPVVYAFYLTYFVYLAFSYVDSLPNMLLIRFQNYNQAFWWLVKRLFYSNMIFTSVNTLILVILLATNDKELSLFYTAKFLLLIQIPLLLINMLMVLTHLLYNERVAFVNGFLFFLIGSFIVTSSGTAKPYSPIYLYLAPLNTFEQVWMLLLVSISYILIMYIIFSIGLKVKSACFLKI